MSLRSGVWLLVMALTAMPALAEDAEPDGITHAIELRAHRALLAQIGEEGAELAPFTTDGCSGGLSEVWRLVSSNLPDFAEAHEALPPWEACCVTHDRAYHAINGVQSAAASFEARKQADVALQSCVIDTGESRKAQLAARYDVEPETVAQAYDMIAKSMYRAVRIGGGPCSGLPWRWGYGWAQCSILQPLGDD